MRDILSKVVTGSMIAGAALLVSACSGGGETNNAAGDNMGDVYNTDLGTENLGGTDMNAGLGNAGTDMNAGMTTGGNMDAGTTGGNMDAGTTGGNMTNQQ